MKPYLTAALCFPALTFAGPVADYVLAHGQLCNHKDMFGVIDQTARLCVVDDISVLVVEKHDGIHPKPVAGATYIQIGESCRIKDETSSEKFGPQDYIKIFQNQWKYLPADADHKMFFDSAYQKVRETIGLVKVPVPDVSHTRIGRPLS